MRKYWFFKETTVYIPTVGTIIGGLVCAAVLLVIIVRSVHPFLSCDSPVTASTLIMEGWLPDYSLEEVAHIASRQRYKTVITTGGPLEKGSFLQEYKTYAEISAATLRKLLPDSIEVIAVPAGFVKKDRTWTAALFLRHWIDSTHCSIRNFNLCSQTTHTRRSRLFFKRALKECNVGSIALEDREYDAKRWWTASSGVRSVVDELVAYFYALLFIHLKT